MANEIQTALISGASGVVGALGAFFGVWIKAKADARAVSTSSPAANAEVAFAGFERLVGRLSTEVDDLRKRIMVLETELTRLRDRERQLEGELRNYQQMENSRKRLDD